MALLTVDGLVGARESKIGGAVIKNIVGAAGWVTCQTGRVIILITIYPIMLLIGIRIGMTTDTGEIGIIRRILVAIGALIPFALVLTTVNGKQHVVLVKRSRPPVGVGSMTCGTLIGKIQNLVVGIHRSLIVGLMAGKTV
jgi:hypothetical protein